MRVLHSAKRFMAAAALAALAVGCGGDSTAPDAPFDPAGTSSDMSAIGASFESPALLSFAAASPEISATTGGTAAMALRAAPTLALVTGGKSGASAYAAALARSYAAPTGPSLATSGIPAELLGVTFVYDTAQDHYVPSDLTGAPSNGVRFLLYAVNPVTGFPIEPLVEVGYVDLVTTETSTSGSANVVVVSGGVTYLDYTAQYTGQATSTTTTINVGVSGYVTNGDDRVNFDLDTRLTSTSSGIDLGLDYVLTVPTRGGFRIDLESTITGAFSGSPSSTLDLTARGPHGTVNISGNATDVAGTFQVRVNGDLFATIEVTAGADPVFTGADGQPLSGAELEALRDVFELFNGGLGFFESLLDPLS
jgi:hypothetical protein